MDSGLNRVAMVEFLLDVNQTAGAHVKMVLLARTVLFRPNAPLDLEAMSVIMVVNLWEPSQIVNVNACMASVVNIVRLNRIFASCTRAPGAVEVVTLQLEPTSSLGSDQIEKFEMLAETLAANGVRWEIRRRR